MTVVFIGLAVLMVVMMALTRAFRGPAPESPAPLAAPGPAPEPDAKALAAALGAALALAQGAAGPSWLGSRPPSPWGAAGRQPQAQPWRGKGRL